MFRFTIRELLLLTLVVALGAGWFMEHRQKAALAKRGVLWREAFQELLDVFMQHTGDRLGTQTPDGDYLYSREREGVVLEGRGFEA